METDKSGRKEMIKQYKEQLPTMGVFMVKNINDKRIFIKSASNMYNPFESTKFQLKMGSHYCRDLQSDYTRLGDEAFRYEVLDTLKRNENPFYDYKADLVELVNLWREKLADDGYTFY